MPYAQNNHGLPSNLEKNAMDPPALARSYLGPTYAPFVFDPLKSKEAVTHMLTVTARFCPLALTPGAVG